MAIFNCYVGSPEGTPKSWKPIGYVRVKTNNSFRGPENSKKAHQMEEAVTQQNLKLQGLEMAWDDSTHQDGLYGAFTLMEMVISTMFGIIIDINGYVMDISKIFHGYPPVN